LHTHNKAEDSLRKAADSEEEEKQGGEDEGCHSQAERRIAHSQAGYSGAVCFYRKTEDCFYRKTEDCFYRKTEDCFYRKPVNCFYRKFEKRKANVEIG